MQHINKLAPAGATQPSAAKQQELPDFKDPAVQVVYKILCDTECAGKPRDEHWEGWQARQIVKALERLQASAIQQSQGERKPVAFGVPDGKGGVKFGRGWAFSPTLNTAVGATLALYT